MKKIFALLLSVMLLVCLTGCASSDYKKATETMEAKDYAAAAAAFEALGDYKDSADLALECGYKNAEALLDDGEYDDAADAFEALGDYKDAEEMISECSYQKAVAAMDDKDYETAIALFTELGDYEDAGEYLEKAGQALLATKYLGTWKAFLDLESIVYDELAAELEISSEEVASFFDFSGYGVDFLLNVAEDNSFALTVDMDAFRKTCDKLGGQMGPGFLKFFEAAFEEVAAEYGMSLDSLYALLGVDDLEGLVAYSLGMDMDEFCAYLADTMYDEFVATIESTGVNDVSGTWVAEEDALVLDADGDETPAAYDVAADTLTVDLFGTAAELGFDSITFTRG